MRLLWLVPVLLTAPLVFGACAWGSGGSGPTCTPQDAKSKQLVNRSGYALACGPGSAVVTFKGMTYRMKGSRCFIGSRGGRLYFGAQRFNTPLPPPRNALYLVVERNRRGSVNVVDGGIDLVSGLRAAIVGKAQATTKLGRGTFTIFGHLGNGKTDTRRFTGSWNCG